MAEDYKTRWPEMDIEYLILETKEFIVCLDSDLDVDWCTNDKYVDPKDENEKLHHAILNRMALLESIPSHELAQKIRVSYKRMLGEAIARSLSGDYDNASKILDSAELFIQGRNGELARSWYLSTGGITTGIIL